MRLIKSTIFVVCTVLLLVGCGDGGGSDNTEIQLDTGTTLDLYCENVGIASETCVLDDPNNPYVNSSIDNINKWQLNDTAPSAKSRFYLWATALARDNDPDSFESGVNQYYTARSLQQLYTEGGSVNAQQQAIKAYRSVMDNYFESITLWGTPEAPIEILLRDLSGEQLYDPAFDSMLNLYAEAIDPQAAALAAMDSWGYTFVPTAEIPGELDRLPTLP